MHAIPTLSRRPGSWWRFLQFPLTRFLLMLVAIGLWVTFVRTSAAFVGLRAHTLPAAFLTVVMAAGVLAIYALFVRRLEQRPVAELSGAGALWLLGIGASIGALLFCVTMLVLWILRAWSFTGLAGWSALFYPFIGALATAVVEETVARALFFRILEEGLGSWAALVVSALAFGLLHTFNPGATLFSSLAVALEAGVLMGAAYLYARRLWLPIGIHFAWNFTEGGVFATNVSGVKGAGLIGVRFTGSDYITGGAFGPEASPVAVLACLAAGAVFIFLARSAGQVTPPAWWRGCRRSSESS